MGLFKRSCSICKSDDSEEVYQQPTKSIVGIGDIGYIQRIVICKNCGFVYSSPILPPESMSAFYATHSNYTYPQSKGKVPLLRQNRWKKRYEFLENQLSGFKGKVLDVGCATGDGLSLFKSKGWDVCGIDPSPKTAELAREFYDIKVITGVFDVSLIANEKPFDLIILCQVLEHMVSPNSTISDIFKILSPDGVVYIEVPNLLCPYVSTGYFTFEHVNYFTPVTLTSLMESNGFTLCNMGDFDKTSGDKHFCNSVAATYKKSTQNSRKRINSDYDVAYKTIAKYKEKSDKEIKRLETRLNSIALKEGSGKIAIWGAGIHTSQLLSTTTLSKMNLVCIFDNDPQKHGEKLAGVKVIPFTDISHQEKQVVDAVIISSKASENEIYKQLSYLEKSGIRVYKLYDIES